MPEFATLPGDTAQSPTNEDAMLRIVLDETPTAVINAIDKFVINVGTDTIRYLYRQPGGDALVALFMFYIVAGKAQGNTGIYANEAYCCKGLGWGHQKFAKVKKQLTDLGMIDTVQVAGKDGKIAKNLIFLSHVNDHGEVIHNQAHRNDDFHHSGDNRNDDFHTSGKNGLAEPKTQKTVNRNDDFHHAKYNVNVIKKDVNTTTVGREASLKKLEAVLTSFKSKYGEQDAAYLTALVKWMLHDKYYKDRPDWAGNTVLGWLKKHGLEKIKIARQKQNADHPTGNVYELRKWLKIVDSQY